MPILNLDDRTLYWRVDGDPTKKRLVLLNSLGTDHSMWDPVVRELLDDFCILRMDKRGHGASSNSSPQASMEDLGRDVLAVMDAAGWDKASVCGVSIGGMQGMWLGVNAPERIERLVLSNTGAKMDTTQLELRMKTIEETQSLEPFLETALSRFFTPEFVEEASPRYHTVREVFRQVQPDGYYACCAAIRDMDQRDTIAAITAPTLVITGTGDQSTPPALGEAIAQSVPGAVVVELPQAHLPMVEDEVAYAQAVRDFLLQA